MDAYTAAAWHWWQECEAAAHGYAAEEAEYREQHPRPTLRAFMLSLSRDWRARRMRLCHPHAGVEVSPEPVIVFAGDAPEWIVECAHCHAVLATAVDRDELFADL